LLRFQKTGNKRVAQSYLDKKLIAIYLRRPGTTELVKVFGWFSSSPPSEYALKIKSDFFAHGEVFGIIHFGVAAIRREPTAGRS
jgi:hypothetical protein